MVQPMFTTAEAADILGVSVATVRRMALNGGPLVSHSVKAAGTRGPRLFEQSAVLRLAAKRAVAAEAKAAS